MNVRKYTFPDRDEVDKGPHISMCTSWKGLGVVVGCDGNGKLESFPKTYPSQRDSFDLRGRVKPSAICYLAHVNHCLMV